MYANQSQSREILTVSALNRMAKNALENQIGQIWLTAEISNFVAAASGHWYFTLKDNNAQVKAAMFRGANSRVGIRPKNGDKILLRAKISLYEPRGDYQIIVEHMEADGEGLLKQQFDALKNKLAAEGLFATQTKQALPANIKKVGVVTSSTGAALHDILTVLETRNPSIEVVIYPTQVQGTTATDQIVSSIYLANQRREVDILIVGRGGGSLEDLWCFNEEKVARAIFGSQLPIVSAVGHEVDVTIADFVADARAATPSQAAELVSKDMLELLNQIVHMEGRLHDAIIQKIQRAQHLLEIKSGKLQQNHPKHKLEQQAQSVDRLSMQLSNAMQHLLNRHKQAANQLHNRLAQQTPTNLINFKAQHLENLAQRLHQANKQQIQRKEQHLGQLSGMLNSVSPLATLSRGYSISFKDEDVVTRAQDVTTGDVLTTRLHDGEIKSKVI